MNNIYKLSNVTLLKCSVHNLYFLLLINKGPVSLFVNTANYQLIIAFFYFNELVHNRKNQKKIQL